MAIKGSLKKTCTNVTMPPGGLCKDLDLHQRAINNLKRPRADKILEETLTNTRPHKCLTKRETEILRLIVEGNTNKKIALALHRSERTVEYHRNHLMAKLSANSVVDLIKRAIAMGLL